MNIIDTADHVKHIPSDEEWLVAFVDRDKLCPCGWPLSYANLSDCELIKKASDDEKHKLLIEMAELNDGSDPRQRYAQRILNNK